MVKRKISKKKVTKFVIILLVIIAIVVGLIIFLTRDKEDNTIKIKSVDTIEGYDYTLNSNATKYYKELFKELKEVLEADEIDEEKYADLATKLFVADFFNLDNKINKNDVGGIQFVYKDFQSDFTKLAASSIYKNVQSNLYNNRNQALPVVTKVSTTAPQKKAFKYGENNDEEAYKVDFDIEYKEDLDYQTAGSLTLIHSNKKLEVAAMEEANN